MFLGHMWVYILVTVVKLMGYTVFDPCWENHVVVWVVSVGDSHYLNKLGFESVAQEERKLAWPTPLLHLAIDFIPVLIQYIHLHLVSSSQ